MRFAWDNHIHTVYCGHADSSMSVANIIARAERLELPGIAITEHSFNWHLGPWGNFNLIRQLVAKTTSTVEVLVGLEIDPDSQEPGRLHFDDFDPGEVFPVLTGFHAYPGMGQGWFQNVNFTYKEKKRIYSRWLKIMEKLVENPKVDVLAHPGRLIMQNGIITEFSGSVAKDWQKLAAAAAENGKIFELNEALLENIPTERLRKSYLEMFRILINAGVKISIGSDAHHPDKIGVFNLTEQFIKDLNITEKHLWVPYQKRRKNHEEAIYPDRTPGSDSDNINTCEHVASGVE